jgi:dihydrodipicolinate synthase/N-acetylneuraminate lyase
MKKNIKEKYSGVIVPMLTPLKENGRIDEKSTIKLINYLISNSTIPFILGTTGELPSICFEQRDKMVKLLIENGNSETPRIVGMGALTFSETIEYSNKYFDWGIDAIVLTLPNYFELTDEQAYNYFYQLSKKINGDIILYNIPITIHSSISLNVIEQLSHLNNIVAIKDSENNKKRILESLERWRGRIDFAHLVGSNALMELGLLNGSVGVVPSLGNILPQLYSGVYQLALNGESDRLKFVQEQTNDFSNVYTEGLLLGESLAALKYLLNLKGLIPSEMFLPLTKLTKEKQELVKNRWKNTLAKYDLIDSLSETFKLSETI